MIKLYLITLIVLLSFDHSFAQCGQCKEATTPYYNILKVNNDKEYVEKFYHFYEMTKQEYEQNRSSSGLSAFLPEYGSAEYKSNKEEIKNIYNRTVSTTNFSLTQKEHTTIFSQTISDEVRIKQLSVLSRCFADCNGKPYLEVKRFTDKEAVILLNLPITTHNKNKKTKIKNIVLSDGLSLADSSFSKNDVLRYGESGTIYLKRNIDQVQSVSIDLKNEGELFVEIPKFIQPEVIAPVWKSTDENGKILQFISNEIIISPIPMTKLGTKKKGMFGGRKKVHYLDPGSQVGLINLNLPTTTHKIENIHFDTIKGSVASNSSRIVVVGDNLHLEYNLNAGIADEVRVKYFLHYQQLRNECVRNCK